jgi:hypothetical protein
MAGYKNCRSAKTAEEYLLKCLFAAEEERDKAVFYAESLKIAENKRIEEEKERNRKFKEKLKEAPVFQVKETKTISFEVEPSYRLIKPEYMIGNFETLSDILQKNDKELYEWASKRYEAKGTSYLSDLTPILRKEKTYDYILAYMEDETTEKIFVSQEWYPQEFIELRTEYYNRTDEIYPLEMEEEVKKMAIQELRKNLQSAIDSFKSE